MESPTSALKLSTLSSLDRVTITLERLMVQYDPNTSISKLAEDLDRRLSLPDGANAAGRLHLMLCESRHDESNASRAEGSGSSSAKEGLVSKWRQKERLKTTAVALVMCLNISVDPPDIIKVSPCARTECWIDPLSMAPQKALDAIGKQLQSQYERWQPRAKYKMHLDPTTEDVKKLAVGSRRTAKNERVLFHYNGHGVPRPTVNGEIWVFNKNYTQYIPLSLYDLQMWIGTPAIYVFDCSSAGQILASFKQFMYQRQQEAESFAPNGTPPGVEGLPNPLRDSILLCACGEHEILPQNADLPADLFTACLTTPIKVALRWFSGRSRLRALRADRDLVDRLPGKQTDRRTPTGELNWIFTAITDTIAWNVLPRALFQRLFRQDLLLASLFRNYLLAERVMRAHGCTPVCHPRLPPTHQHPMWQAWDLAAEMCLLQMPAVIDTGGKVEYKPSPFFSEQLTAFELWLEHGAKDKSPPEQLPIVLQVLLSQVHRLRALVLLGRFLDMGYWAVDLALSVGIFPYVLKLLQTTAPDLRQTLVFIWTKILAWDSNAQVQTDLVKDGGHLYFLKHLDAREQSVANESRAHAAFVLAAVCDGHPRGQALLASAGMLQITMQLLPSVLTALSAADADGETARGVSTAVGTAPTPHASPELRTHPSTRALRLLAKWLLLAVGKLADGQPSVVSAILRDSHHNLAIDLLSADNPELRAAAVFLLGSLIALPTATRSEPSTQLQPTSGEGSSTQERDDQGSDADRLVRERELASALLQVVYDASPLVRAEVAVALSRIAIAHSLLFQDAVHVHQRTAAHIPPRTATAQSATSSGGSVPVGGSAPTGIVRSADAVVAGTAVPSVISNRPSSDHGLGEKDTSDTIQAESAPSRAGLSGIAPRGPVSALRAGSLPLSSLREASMGSSPGVRARGDDAFEPLLRVGLGEDQPASSASGIYASADAARVGGGLYSAMVEALCTLSTDPAPRVARAGISALRAVGIELVLVHAPADSTLPQGGGPTPSNGSASGSLAVAGASPKPPLRDGVTGSSSATGLDRSASIIPKSWQPRAWRVGPGAPTPSRQASLAIPMASPHTSPPRTATIIASTRPSYVLRRFAEDPHAPHDAPHFTSGNAPPPTTASAGPSSTVPSTQPTSHPSRQGAIPKGRTGSRRAPPTSFAYRDSATAFTFPLLSPQSTESPGPPHAKWLLEPDADRVAGRVEYRIDHLRNLRAMCEPGRQLRISENVNPVNTGAERVEALCLDPIRSLLLTADGDGYLRVTSCNPKKGASEASLNRHVPPPDVQNHFHVVTGHVPGSATHAPHTTIRSLHVLNEMCNSLVLTCAADGAVRVWRNFTQAHAQQLASAWQAVMVPPPGVAGAPASYCWDARQRRLHAAGGRLAGRIYTWDLERESCIAQFRTRDVPTTNPADRLQHLAAYTTSSLLAGADSQGTVWLFDVRASGAPVGSLSPGLGRLAGLCAEPGGVEHAAVLGTPDGKLAFMDARVISGSSSTEGGGAGSRLEAGIWKTIEAHGKGNMTALAGHQNAPLLATATANQVVKVWNTRGEAMGVIRAHTSFLSHRPGPLTCLSWKAYDPVLAAGGADYIAPIYYLEDATQRGGTSRTSLSATTSEGALTDSAA